MVLNKIESLEYWFKSPSLLLWIGQSVFSACYVVVTIIFSFIVNSKLIVICFFCSQGSESENESVRSDPHSFVNHYANVNDSLRQSWKRQKPVRNYSSYTDSEPEGSAVVSLNGGQIIMNNMARSRAPLPGFSSFVWIWPPSPSFVITSSLLSSHS